MKENVKLKRRIVYRGQVYDALEAERIKSLGNIAKQYYDGYADGLKRAIQILANDVEDVPDADVQPVVRGQWIKHNATHVQKGGMYLECSCCHEYITVLGHVFAYCPNCGADMREVTT